MHIPSSYQIVLLFIVLVSCNSSKKEPEFHIAYPFSTLKNDIMEVTVLLPDKEKGYYRSSRFDWSGIISEVKYKGHTFFKTLESTDCEATNNKHNPEISGLATGTAEEFREPLGYNEAIIGQPFVKVGVGILEKAKDTAYHWEYPYNILDTGEWATIKKDNEITFIHKLESDFGYAYEHVKTISIHNTKPEITVAHELKNIGDKIIKTNPYCHNYFKFDGDAIGGNYVLSFPNEIQSKSNFGELANFKKNSLFLKNELKEDIVVQGIIETNGAKHFTLSNKKTKTAVEVIYDTVPEFFYLYAWSIAFCPEPMVFMNIEPNTSFNWSFSYSFSKD